MTKPADAAEFLKLLIAQAPELRRVGVSKVEIDGFSFELRPHELEAPAQTDKDDNAEEVARANDPLHDPATFGRRSVPGNPKRGREQ